jgi:DNA-binding CsgD family transcriptional regulator
MRRCRTGSDAQAAAILGISVRTVQKHLEHIYEKLGVEGRTAAVMRVRATKTNSIALWVEQRKAAW